MTATIPNNAGAELPDCQPLTASALGPELNEQGYHVDRVERNLFWVTDSVYLSAFLATADGVVVFDAPPTIGHNIQRAIDEVTAGEGTTNRVTHLVYSHHHADHSGAASLFPDAAVIGHEDTKRRLVRDADPTRPAPSITFENQYTLEVGGERVVLDHRGPNHTPDNIFMHFPDHDALMLVDVVNPGWVPVFNSNLSEDIPGYIDAPAQALEYPWTKLMAGHMGRLATRDDVTLHQAFIADIVDASYTRPGRRGEHVAHWVMERARARTDAEVELIDLIDYPLPHLDEPLPPNMGQYQNPHSQDCAKTIGRFDGFVFVTPEYNHSTSGVLKNAIDYVYAEWNNKAMGVVSYGATGGTRAAEHLRLIAGELQLADVRTNVALSLFTDFTDFTELTPAAHQGQALDTLLDQVIAWSQALAPVRQLSPVA
jgi:NAD(P)H-dependent FMN reductase